MTPANRHILLGTLVSVSLVALLTIESRPVAHAARVPKGTPINLVMNVHPKDLKAVVQAYVDGVLQGAPKEKFAELQPQNHAAALQRVQEKMLEVSLCPDFIEDRGHTFGRDLSDQDKRALIEYMKYF